jgi:hypothetical protein
MKMRERVLWVGVMLLVFGVTGAAMSYVNLHHSEEEHLGPLILAIDAGSSSDFMLLTGIAPGMKSLEVKIYWFPRLDILDITLNYTRPTRPYTVSLYEEGGAGRLSKTFDWRISPVTHVFDIPEDWRYLYKTTVFNYDDHPICLVEEITFSRQTLDSNMQTAVIIGVAFSVFGIAVVSAAMPMPRFMGKQARDAGIGELISKRRGLRIGVPMVEGRIKLYVESTRVLTGFHSAESIDRIGSEWMGTKPKYDFVLPEEQEKVVGIVRESCQTLGFELVVVDVTQQDGLHRAIITTFGGIRESPTIVSGSGRRIQGIISKDQVDAFLSKEKKTWI